MRTSIICKAIVSIFFIGEVTYAQLANFHKVNGEPLALLKYDKVEGSPYLGDGNWMLGTFTDNHGTRFENVSLRYNAYEDNLEAKNGANIVVINRTTVGSFELYFVDDLGNRRFFFFKNGFSIPGQLDKFVNFRILYDSDVLKVIESVKKIQISTTPYGEEDYKKFATSSETYILTNHQTIKTRISQKAFLKAFPAFKSQIKDFFKSDNIDLADEKDLKRTCDYVISVLPK